MSHLIRPFQIALLALCVPAMLGVPAAAQDEPAPQPPTAWMGIRITPVPEALAAHLPLGRTDQRPDVGVMVLNVVADGPADKAGLKQYDVIIALGDEPTTDQMGRFVRNLGKYRPGEKVRLTVVRGARRVNLSITMAKAKPALKTRYTYRYPEQPEGVYAERHDFRGAIVTRGDTGWQWQDFREADPALFADLPADVRERIMQRFGPIAPVDRTMVRQGGRTIEMIDHNDGRVTVRTSARDEQGVEQIAARTYASLEALQRSDPEAHKLHQRIAADPTLAPPVRTPGDNDNDDDGVAMASRGDTDTDADPERVARILEDAQAYQDQIRAYEKFLEQYTEYLRRKVDDPDSVGQAVPDRWKRMLDQAGDRLPPQREFKVHEDGRIDVRLRRAQGDLIISFRGEDELAQQYPKLHAHYRNLVEAGDE